VSQLSDFYSEPLNVMTIRNVRRRYFNDNTPDVETSACHVSESRVRQLIGDKLKLPYGFQYIELFDVRNMSVCLCVINSYLI
jgi:hypothetical protein